MSTTSTRLLAFATMLGLLAVWCPADVSAQTADHLKCFKAKGAKQFKKATADLDALQAQFPDENCTISGGVKEVCIPADKDNVVIEDGTHTPFTAQELQFAQLCYKLKCPKVDLAPVTVTDQFGVRDMSKFKAAKLCTPASETP